MSLAKPQTQPKSTTKEFVPDWQVIAGLKRSRLGELVAEGLALQEQKKRIEAQLSELKAEGLKLMVKADVKSVLVAGARVTRIDGSSSRLDKELLVRNHGVKVLDWLKEATVQTPFTSLKLTPPGEDKED